MDNRTDKEKKAEGGRRRVANTEAKEKARALLAKPDKVITRTGIHDDMLVIDDETTVLQLEGLGAETVHINEVIATLTPKMSKFVKYYERSKDKAQSCIYAGYPEKNAKRMANKLLNDPRIKLYLQYLDTKKLQSAGVSKASVLAELAVMGFSNIMDFMEVHNTTLASKDKNGAILRDKDNNEITSTYQSLIIKKETQIPIEQWKAVKSLKQDKDGNITITLHDKLPALKEISDILGLKKEEDNGNTGGMNILNIFTGNNQEENQADMFNVVANAYKRMSSEQKPATNDTEVIDVESTEE